MLGLLKFRNKPNTEYRNGIMVKIANPSTEVAKNEEERQNEEEERQKEERQNEERQEQEPTTKKPMKIVDVRKTTNINRELILRKLRGEPLSIEMEEATIQTDNTLPKKAIQDLVFETITETEKEAEKEVPKEAEKEMPKEKAPPKKRVVIRRDVKLAEPIITARETAIGQKETVDIKNLEKKMAKPVNYDKVIMHASSYYMNNRRLYLQKINQFFEKYKKEFAHMEETEVTCENRDSKKDIELFLHQKVVRDYLNIYTPYRGLLLYHGLGSGKTCTSIAIAEGMKSHKGIIVMTPASLKMNFFAQLKKCGDQLYKKEQFWKFLSVEGKPDLADALSATLSLPHEFVKKHRGAWFVDIHKPSNFAELNPGEQQQIDDQLNAMIRTKYTDINYNGLNWNIINRLTEDQTVNPFDNKVVIIDEAHNFVSRVVNKIKSPKNSISILLYNYLMSAENAKIVLLTGTPIINYPNEIGVLFNMLRGFIKTWSMQLRMEGKGKISRDSILDLFEKEGFHIYDYVDYTGNTLTITRNPYGFINTSSVKRGIPRGTKKNRGGAKRLRKTKKIYKEEMIPTVSLETDDKELTEKEREEAENIVEQYREIYKENPHEGGGYAAPVSKNENIGTDIAVGATTIFALPTMMEGGKTAFESYNGVTLDETGNITDNEFIRRVTSILKKYDIDVVPSSLQLTLNKALPDDSADFISTFIDSNEINRASVPALKRRILGLTSYFRSAQESLLPQYIPTENNDIYHVVPCVMSNYQLGEYSRIRKEEADKEKKQKTKQRMAKNEDLFNIASSYRIFSRACCNFAFPKPPGRPIPSGKKLLTEKDLDALPLNEEENMEREGDEPEEGEEEAKGTEEGEPEEVPRNAEYLASIQRAMAAIAYDPSKPADENPLSPEGLAIYSPKFFHILENLQEPNHRGLHLLYSNFRTIEGIGILRLVLQANGFVEFKLERNASAGIWDVTEESFPTAEEIETDTVKPRFVLYTGTETAEEKEVIRNIFNSDWNLVPKNILTSLEKRSGGSIKNNFMGEVIKLMMITAAGAEGINLKNTRYVHIVEPYWHMVRLEQVVGRARRICSHADLPPELRTIQVFLYISVFSPEQKMDDKNTELRLRDVSKLDGKTPITTDESLYEVSIIKDKINRELLKSIKETAVDCSIYAHAHEKENLVCYGFGKVESNQFASYPILEQDLGEKEEVQKKTVQMNRVQVGEKTYMMDVKTNDLFELADYQRAKTTGADLVAIGRLVKGPGGYEIVSTKEAERRPAKPLGINPLAKKAAESPKDVEEEAEKPKEKTPKEKTPTSLEEEAEPPKEKVPESPKYLETDKEIQFVFSDKSTDKALPGKGPGEKISKSKMAEFKELAEIPDWRKKLDTTWPVEIELNGKTWASAEHFIQASKYKTGAHPLYEAFAMESGTDLSKDAEMARAVGETGKFKGKVYKVDGVKKIQVDTNFDEEAAAYQANFAKFSKHADLREVLVKTKTAGLYRNLRGKEPELQESLLRVRNRFA